MQSTRPKPTRQDPVRLKTMHQKMTGLAALIAAAVLLFAILILAGCSGSASRDLPVEPGRFDTGEAAEPSAESTEEESTEPSADSTEKETVEPSPESTEEGSADDTSSAGHEETSTQEDAPSSEGEDLSSTAPEASASDSDNGARYDTGLFRAFCPEGWENFPVKDFWEADKLDETALQFIKGTLKNEFDFYNHAGLRLTCYGIDVYLMDSKSYYEDVKDVTLTDAAGRTWNGFTGMYGSTKNFWLHAQDEKHHYVATGTLEARDSSITLLDHDVILILSSVIGNDMVPEETSPDHSGTTDESAPEETTSTEETLSSEEPTSKSEEASASETPTYGTISSEPEEPTPAIRPTETDAIASVTRPADAPDEVTTTVPEAPEHVFNASEAVEISYDHAAETMTAVFHTLPERLEDVSALVEEYGLGEHNMAIWFVTAMHLYEKDPLEAVKIMTALSEESTANHLVSFVTDQLKEKPYLGSAYFKGALKDNGFTPQEPLTVTVSKTSGTDPRYLYLRVHTDADAKERTIAFMNDGRVVPAIAALPSLVLGIY